MTTVLDRQLPPEVKEFGLLTMPPLESCRLDNGLPLYVVNQGEQEVCSVTCVWRGGVAEASSNAIPSLTLNLMREGSEKHGGEELADMIEFNGARLFTTADSHFSTMKMFTLNSKIGNVLPLLPEMMLAPSFPGNNFDVLKEKAAKNLEIMAEKVEYQASRLCGTMVMGAGHPLTAAASPADIRSITLDDVRTWHRAMFRPCVDADGNSSLSVYAAGKITPEIMRLLNDVFGKIDVEHTSLQPFNIKKFECNCADRRMHKVDGAMQSAVRLYMPAIGRDHPDYIALRLLITALGGYFGSRLMSNIRENKGYTYGINSYLLGYPEGGLIGVSSSTDNIHVESLISEVIKEIRRLSDGDFKSEEMKRLKQHAMSTLAAYLDSPFEIVDYHVDMATQFIAPRYFERQIEVIQSVTPQELARVAREHIDLNRLNIAVAGG